MVYGRTEGQMGLMGPHSLPRNNSRPSRPPSLKKQTLVFMRIGPISPPRPCRRPPWNLRKVPTKRRPKPAAGARRMTVLRSGKNRCVGPTNPQLGLMGPPCPGRHLPFFPRHVVEGLLNSRPREIAFIAGFAFSGPPRATGLYFCLVRTLHNA